jgi:glutamyl-tRNA synthetase
MYSFANQFFDFAGSITSKSRLRIAPTPSGFLHLGNALNFTLNWLAAKFGGRRISDASPANILLRIDDLDVERKRQEFEDDIFESLQWLKLDWDEPPIRQSNHLTRYFEILDRLRAKNLLFACRKSRKDLEPFGGVYPAEFRNQQLNLDADDVAWRIKTPPGFPLPDFVVRRRDGIPAFQVASFADDLHFGMTHIIRGADLADSTAAQCFLASELSEEKFLKINFLHHPLVLGEAGEKLSKSAGSASLKALREAGRGPEKVFQTVGELLDLEGNSANSLLESLHLRLT